jgi:ribosomal protein L7Ae-like RNA K-turn-binding protein
MNRPVKGPDPGQDLGPDQSPVQAKRPGLEAAWRLLGLAKRAGRAITGNDTVEMAVRKGQVHLIILASDATENARDRCERLAKYHQIPLIVLGTRAELGHWTGKDERVVAAITDAGFAERLRQIYEDAMN